MGRTVARTRRRHEEVQWRKGKSFDEKKFAAYFYIAITELFQKITNKLQNIRKKKQWSLPLPLLTLQQK